MITFDEPTHTYRKDGVIVPSVTQILSVADLYVHIDKALLARASKFGTAVHKATELHDKGTLNLLSLSVALAPYLDGWKKFKKDTDFKILESESVVYSKMGYAGTLDRIGTMGGKLTLLDIKTTTTIPKTIALQLGAYRHAWQEMHGKTIEQVISVQLKPCNYFIRDYDDPTAILTFRSFIEIYKWRHNV